MSPRSSQNHTQLNHFTWCGSYSVTQSKCFSRDLKNVIPNWLRRDYTGKSHVLTVLNQVEGHIMLSVLAALLMLGTNRHSIADIFHPCKQTHLPCLIRLGIQLHSWSIQAGEKRTTSSKHTECFSSVRLETAPIQQQDCSQCLCKYSPIDPSWPPSSKSVRTLVLYYAPGSEFKAIIKRAPKWAGQTRGKRGKESVRPML